MYIAIYYNICNLHLVTRTFHFVGLSVILLHDNRAHTMFLQTTVFIEIRLWFYSDNNKYGYGMTISNV